VPLLFRGYTPYLHFSSTLHHCEVPACLSVCSSDVAPQWVCGGPSCSDQVANGDLQALQNFALIRILGYFLVLDCEVWSFRGGAFLSIDLDQFALKEAILEVRYPDAFLFWDHVGSFWDGMAARYPGLEMDEASPQETKVKFDANTIGNVFINRAFCAIARPKSNLADLQDLGEAFFHSLLSILNVNSLSRIGFRLVYYKSFEQRAAASEFVRSQGSMPKPADKLLNVDGQLVDPHAEMRFEGEKLGFKLVLRSQETTLTVPLPPEFRDLAPLKTTRSIATLEVDYYTTANTPSAAFDARALVTSWYQVIKRDLEKVF